MNIIKLFPSGFRARLSPIIRHTGFVLLTLLIITGGVAPSIAVADEGDQSSTGAATGTSLALDSTDSTTPALVPPTGTRAATDSMANESNATDENVTETAVTLVSGHTVTVVRSGNETSYLVNGSATTYQVETDRGTYVFPQSVDLRNVSRNLFNVDMLVRHNLTDERTNTTRLLVQRRTDVDTSGGLDDLASRLDGLSNVRTTAQIGLTDTVVVEVAKTNSSDPFDQIAEDRAVESVWLDQPVSAQMVEANEIVNATHARTDYGVNGSNVTVAVIDSGVDNDHPMLAGSVVDEYDFIEGDAVAQDETGHGTHVAGTIAGRPTASNPNLTGIAPNASIMDLRVLGPSTNYGSSRVMLAIEYAVDNDADIISMSLGGLTEGNDPYFAAVESATAAGIPVVVAAGNSGPTQYTIRTPGVVPASITVGATNKTDDLIWFSSRGPTPLRGHVKPDLVAPGVNIVSAEAGTDGYTVKSGTSMATPMVSGAAALLLAEHPNWSVTQVRSALVTTSDPLSGYSAYETGAGRLNVSRALGNEIVVSPSTLQYGTIIGNTTKSVTLHNIGNETRTLEFDLSSSTLGSGYAVVDVDATTITLAPNETQTVSVTAFGTHRTTASARLEINDTAHEARSGGWKRASLGWRSVTALTVDVEGRNGTSTAGDTVILARGVNVVETASLDANGEFRKQVSPGNYTVVVVGEDESAGGRTIYSVGEIEASENAVLDLDESNTVPYGFDTTGIATIGERLTEIRRQSTVTAGPITVESTQWHPAGRGVLVTPGQGVDASLYSVFAPEAAYPNSSITFDSPDLYTLVNVTREIAGTTMIAPDQSTLVSRNVTYHRSTHGDALTVDIGAEVAGVTWAEYDPSPVVALDGRSAQTVWSTPTVEGADVRYDHRVTTADGLTIATGSAPLGSDYRLGADPLFVSTLQPTLATYDGGSNGIEFVAVDRSEQPLIVGGGHTLTCATSKNGTTTTSPSEGSGCFVPLDQPTPKDGTTLRFRTNTTFTESNGPVESELTYATSVRDGSVVTVPVVEAVRFDDLTASNTVVNRTLSATVRFDESIENTTVHARYTRDGVTTAPTTGDPTVTNGDWNDASVSVVDAAAGVVEVTFEPREYYHGRYHLSLSAVGGDDEYTTTTTYGAITSTWAVTADRNVTMRVVEPDGTAERSSTVVSADGGQVSSAPLDANGSVTYGVTNGTTPATFISEVVVDGDSGTAPIDGVVDIHALDVGTVTGDTDLGTVTLPVGHRLNVSVESDTGAPVENATVKLSAVPEGIDPDNAMPSPGVTASTDSDGQLAVGGTRGTEVNGTVVITVFAPNTSTFVAGEQRAVVNVTSNQTHAVTLATTSTDDGSGSGSGSTGGGDSANERDDTLSTGDADTADLPTNTTNRSEVFSVRAETSTEGMTVMRFENGRSGENTSAILDGVITRGVSMTGMALSLSQNRSEFELHVRPLTADDDTGLPAGPTALGSFDVQKIGVTNDDIDSVTIGFQLPDSALPEGATSGDVRVYRADNGTYSVVETTAHGEGVYTATIDGFSIVTIGADMRTPASLEVTNTDLSSETVKPGESVTLTAVVENTGELAGNRTLSIQVDGETIATRQITLESGTRQTVTAPIPFAEDGRYLVALDGEDVGTVTANGVGEGTAAVRPTEGVNVTPASEAAGGFVPGLGPSVAALLIATVAVVAVLRRRR